jgi:tRNA threonylcarbamoyladenosine biosynthesis protein TsaE
VGAECAAGSSPGDCFVLCGALGAGKTEFIRGFIHYFDPSIRVRSPSFSLVYEYRLDSFPVFHFDFYRLTHVDELINVGYSEYVEKTDGIVCIEWGMKFPEVLPRHSTYVTIEDHSPSEREIDISSLPKM